MKYFLTAAYTNKDNETDIFSKKVTGTTLKEVMADAWENAPGIITWWTIVEIETGEVVAKKSEHRGKVYEKRNAFAEQQYN